MEALHSRRFTLQALAALLLAAGSGQPVLADTFPSRPVRIIMPLAAGSSDNVVRLAANLLANELRQSTFVDNRPGGDSLVAVQNLLGSPADGYSMLYLSPGSMVINPLTVDNLPYDALRDIRPLAGATRTFAVLVTGADSRFKSFADVLAAAHAAPKSVSMASYAVTYRLAGFGIQQRAGVEFNHAPYKSASLVQNDLIGNNVDIALMDISTARQLVQSGKLRALAVTTKERHPQLPAVPTIREGGVNFDLYIWTGFGVSAKTPEPIAQVLEAALLKVMKQPEFLNYVQQTSGAEVLAMTGKEFTAMIRSEIMRYKDVTQRLNNAHR